MVRVYSLLSRKEGRLFVIKISGLEAESHIPGAVGEPLTCTGAPCGLIAFGPNARVLFI